VLVVVALHVDVHDEALVQTYPYPGYALSPGLIRLPSVLTASRGGHTIVTTIIAMRCVFIRSVRQFQERNGAGYGHLLASYRIRPLDGVHAEGELIALRKLMYSQYVWALVKPR